MSCIEDVLHMVIRAVSQKPLLAAFLEQVNMVGGCHIFVNLLHRCASIMNLIIDDMLLFLSRTANSFPKSFVSSFPISL